jgi:hypothetical protein
MRPGETAFDVICSCSEMGYRYAWYTGTGIPSNKPMCNELTVKSYRRRR